MPEYGFLVMSQSKFVYFVHVERAGGTTLHRILQNMFPRYLALRPWWCWANEPENAVQREELSALCRWLPGLAGVGGHTTRSWNVGPRLDSHLNRHSNEHLGGREVLRFTFLRDPIARYMSHFNYQRVRMGIPWTIDEFVAEKRFANYHTKRYSGGFDLDEAKRALDEDFDFVGLTDRFDESLLLWRHALGRPDLSVQYERENALKEADLIRFDDLSAKQRLAVEDANALDLELIEYGRETIFAQQHRAYPGDLEQELVILRDANVGFQFPRWRARLMWPLIKVAKELIEPVLHAKHDRPRPTRR